MIIQLMLLGLVVCCFLCAWRIFKGPTAPDRSVAVDILGIVVIGFCAVLTLTHRQEALMDIALAWTLQSFIAVLALAKYLEGKRFDE